MCALLRVGSSIYSVTKSCGMKSCIVLPPWSQFDSQVPSLKRVPPLCVGIFASLKSLWSILQSTEIPILDGSSH